MRALRDFEVRGSAFKLVMALERLPGVANLPDGIDAEHALQAQFRIAPSARYIDLAILDGLAGRCSAAPIMWGLVPSLTSPGLAPEGRHLLSVNVWHAPYELESGSWTTERDRFGTRCIEILDRSLPGLKDAIVDHRFMGAPTRSRTSSASRDRTSPTGTCFLASCSDSGPTYARATTVARSRGCTWPEPARGPAAT